MRTTRLEAFSDGVIAIAITIMVLELKAPEGNTWGSLRPLAPTFAANLLTFAHIGIYWNNHHHMLQATSSVNGAILWANLHLLFWLALLPFTTAWMGKTDVSAVPTAAYGISLLGSAVAYALLQWAILSHEGPTSKLKAAIGSDRKEYISLLLYVIAIAAAWIQPWISVVLYIVVAAQWAIPDPRIERRLHSPE